MYFDSIESAIEDIKLGKMVVVLDDEDRENEGDLIMAADLITPEAINFMATHGRGLICTPLPQTLAQKLDFPLMVGHNNSSHQTAFTISIDAANGGTGISATDRALTVKLLTEKETIPADFMRPGHIFPLIAKSGGVLERPGHTEAAVDLAILAGRAPVGVICEILNEDGTMARRDQLLALAKSWNLKTITIKDLITYRKNELLKVKLPSSHGDFDLYLFDQDGQDHLALVMGELDQMRADDKTLVRIHSECLTGDIFSSLRCDCGPQLQKSLKKIEEAGRGILIYLRQEGRGIGLKNKLKAYQLQEEGLDTVEANHQLGLDGDLRKYDQAAHILLSFGLTKIQLLTNNPDKVEQLGQNGIIVEQRIPLEIRPQETNLPYLFTKKNKMGHFLELKGDHHDSNY